MTRFPVRRLAGGLTAGLAATALVALSAGPGAAATVVARASATAFEITIAGNAQNTGAYSVSNDGTTETSSGSRTPAVTIPGLGAASVGTLAQDAQTRVVNRNGRSAACSGLAGDGATLVAIGDSGCLTPGDNLSLAGGSLDLASLAVVPAELNNQLPAQLQKLLVAVTGPGGDGLAQLNTIIQEALAAVGDPSLTLDIGAIQASCTAQAPSAADGDSQLTDVSLNASIPGQDDLTLVEFPTSAPPNTKVPTQADVLVDALNTAIEAQLTQGLNGATGPLAGAIKGAVQQINAAVIAQIAPQLAPLEENLLSGTINKQTRSPGAIDVTALEVEVLPAARQFIDQSLVSLAIGNVTCGPSDRAAAPSTPTPTRDPGTPAPPVPTVVPAGEATAAPRTGDGSLNDTIALWTLGGLALVSGGVGVAAYRRAAR